MLQGTFSHERPGKLSISPLLGGRFPAHVAERISQVTLTADNFWVSAEGWCFDTPPARTRALLRCLTIVDKAAVAAVVGAG